MSYIINKARLAALSIGGVDYTDDMISWIVTDDTAYNNGCVITQGTVVLGTQPGSVLQEDYGRSRFKRGQEVLLLMTYPDGTVARHPRGLLYVSGSAYNVEDATFEVSISCEIGLAALNDEVDHLVSLSPIHLDPVQQEFGNISGAFASAAQYLYQDNQGDLISGDFFAGDSTSGTAAGEWVSILGVTALSASPLMGADTIPDIINLTYQAPSNLVAGDNQGRVDTVTTESYYFLDYPATNYVRVNEDASEDNPNGTLTNASAGVFIDYTPVSGTSGCGGVVVQPSANGAGGCQNGYTLQREPMYLPAKRKDVSVTEYNGPGGQVSYTKREIYGPKVEAQTQYFADKYSHCIGTWGSGCQPNGGCTPYGMDQILLSKSETTYTYGNGGEVKKTVTDNFRTLLSAGQVTDWRSGTVDGLPQDFDSNFDSNTQLFRDSSVTAEYEEVDNGNRETITTFTSVTGRGVGINSGVNLDALAGIETKTVRTSTTITAVDIAPDGINSEQTDTTEQETSITLFTGRYTDANISFAGPNELGMQIPMPLLYDTIGEVNAAVDKYSDYVSRFIKGDSFGIRISEALREDIATNWRPGMPFRYYDPSKGKLFAMRMDACVWGVTADESIVTINGLWIGDSNGTVTIPSNVTGNATPNMSGTGETPTPPGGTVTPPSVGNETSVDSGSFAFDVNVYMMLQNTTPVYGTNHVVPPIPSDLSYNTYFTTTCFVGGLIVEAGGTFENTSTGSVPIEYNGVILTDDSVVVTADLFA